MSAPPPGWYPDPQNGHFLRWWDGHAWTLHTQARPATAPPAPAPPVAPPRSVPRAAAVEAEHAENAQLRGTVATTTATELARLQTDAANLRREIAALHAERAVAQEQLIHTSEAMALQEVGLYRYRHPLDDAAAYKERLATIDADLKEAVRAGKAVKKAARWTVNGSEKDGARMVSDFSKLMLRAYNNEADAAVRQLKPYALDVAIERLNKVRATISKLGTSMQIEILEPYHRLRVAELELTADYLSKVAEEKERLREERARLREEAKAQEEFEREQDRLEKEYAHYEAVLAALRKAGDAAAAAKAEAKLGEIQTAIDGVTERQANIRAGYVYVISNIGAFGERMVKIGLTRRLEPMDRVRELGDASVPFRFDVHALVFSADAVTLETRLHHAFAQKRVNWVNPRREFFYATPLEVKEILQTFEGDLLQYEEIPEALEWRQSQNALGGAGGATPGA